MSSPSHTPSRRRGAPISAFSLGQCVSGAKGALAADTTNDPGNESPFPPSRRERSKSQHAENPSHMRLLFTEVGTNGDGVSAPLRYSSLAAATQRRAPLTVGVNGTAAVAPTTCRAVVPRNPPRAVREVVPECPHPNRMATAASSLHQVPADTAVKTSARRFPIIGTMRTVRKTSPRSRQTDEGDEEGADARTGSRAHGTTRERSGGFPLRSSGWFASSEVRSPAYTASDASATVPRRMVVPAGESSAFVRTDVAAHTTARGTAPYGLPSARAQPKMSSTMRCGELSLSPSLNPTPRAHPILPSAESEAGDVSSEKALRSSAKSSSELSSDRLPAPQTFPSTFDCAGTTEALHTHVSSAAQHESFAPSVKSIVGPHHDSPSQATGLPSSTECSLTWPLARVAADHPHGSSATHMASLSAQRKDLYTPPPPNSTDICKGGAAPLHGRSGPDHSPSPADQPTLTLSPPPPQSVNSHTSINPLATPMDRHKVLSDSGGAPAVVVHISEPHQQQPVRPVTPSAGMTMRAPIASQRALTSNTASSVGPPRVLSARPFSKDGQAAVVRGGGRVVAQSMPALISVREKSRPASHSPKPSRTNSDGSPLRALRSLDRQGSATRTHTSAGRTGRGGPSSVTRPSSTSKVMASVELVKRALKERRRRELYAWNVQLSALNEAEVQDAV